jgi:hypothetical protein
VTWLRSVAAASLLLLACADDEETATLPCDVRTRACQKAVFIATAQARGQQGARLPPVRVITRKQLAEELAEAVAAQAGRRDEAEARLSRQEQQAMALLKLMPAPDVQSSDDAYVEQAVSGIAAYYSSFSKDITVIADQAQDPDNGTFTLSHEFVHALQDQREDLTLWRKPLMKTSDDSVAAKALTEGEATWLSYVTYFAQVRDVPADEIETDRLFQPMLMGFLADIASQPAPLLNALESLPYPLGGDEVAEVYLGTGISAVQALYKAPRTTLREWADPAIPGLPEALDCALPSAPEGYARVLDDRLGFAGLLAFYTALGQNGEAAYQSALAWRGDALVAYADDAAPEAVAVAWRLRLASSEAAEQLAALAASHTIEARASANEVLLAAATQADLLQAWLPFEVCGSADKGRSHPDERRPTLDELLGIVR